MYNISFKNAIFFPDKIELIKKKGNVIIDVGAIDYIKYKKPSLFNYLFASICGETFPGWLDIYIKDNIFTRKLYYTNRFFIRIKYKDYIKLPEIYHQLVR